VLSSHHEGFPNVVLEALACGTPVIATPAPGGLQEILGDVPECVVVPSVSATALADGIKTWLAGERKRIPQAATERYALKRIIAQYEEAIRP
jgi:glycosyltransferase involved in cell wall biosynthesis